MHFITLMSSNTSKTIKFTDDFWETQPLVKSIRQDFLVGNFRVRGASPKNPRYFLTRKHNSDRATILQTSRDGQGKQTSNTRRST